MITSSNMKHMHVQCCLCLRGGTASVGSPFYLKLQISSSQIRLTKEIKIRDEKMKEDQMSQMQIKKVKINR